MRYVTSIILVLAAQCVRAQQSPAAMDYFSRMTDCSASLGGWKCLDLDLSSETVSEEDSTKTYAYSWNFGDGTRIGGNKVEHCYENFGSYQVTMDLIDTETNAVIRNELSSTLHLYPEIFPVIESRSEGLPPTYLEFSAKFEGAGNFIPDRVYWRIGNVFYENNTIVHAFPVAGVYAVEMAMEKDMDFIGTITACTTATITIKESDLWTTPILNYFKTVRSALESGPFATDDIACYLKNKNRGEGAYSVIPLKTLMSEIDPDEGHQYEIILFSGNLFSDKKQLNLQGLQGNDLYKALMDTVSAFTLQPLFSLKPVILAGSPASRSEDIAGLEETAELLLQNPFLQIEVGAYIHTGSRITKGIQNSVSRAVAIKEELIRHGIGPERIQVASPEFNSVLVNTCSALSDCAWENKALNGKVEFKITGSTL